MSRITRNGKMLCVPVDHSFTVGPIKGLEDPQRLLKQVASGGATCFLAHKGVLKSLSSNEGIGLILHVSASTSVGMFPNRKVLVSGIEEAVRIGADALSIHVNIGCKEEPEMVKDPADPETIAHVARIGSDAGADIVKTVYTGSVETFREVVRRCQVPVVLAGGQKLNSDGDLLRMTYDALRAGAMGVAFGRNIFQHDNPNLIVRLLSKIVFDGLKPEEIVEVERRT